MKIAIVGGTGEQGPGLALRWALAGEEVIIGSRQKEKGERVAAELNQELGRPLLVGTDNPRAAAAADIVHASPSLLLLRQPHRRDRNPPDPLGRTVPRVGQGRRARRRPAAPVFGAM